MYMYRINTILAKHLLHLSFSVLTTFTKDFPNGLAGGVNPNVSPRLSIVIGNDSQVG